MMNLAPFTSAELADLERIARRAVDDPVRGMDEYLVRFDPVTVLRLLITIPSGMPEARTPKEVVENILKRVNGLDQQVRNKRPKRGEAHCAQCGHERWNPVHNQVKATYYHPFKRER